MRQLRAAATSLTNGVIKGLQVLGFVREEESLRRIVLDSEPCGQLSLATVASAPVSARSTTTGKSGDGSFRNIEIEDLLEWEKMGKSLSSRISRQWHGKEVAGVPSIMAMLEKKADVGDLDELKLLLRDNLPLHGRISAASPIGQGVPPLPPLTPSQQARARRIP